MIQYTRNFEDVIIGRVLADVAVGFYVDVGASHPWIDSNTFALYTRGWRGLCFEPHPGAAHLWPACRPRDHYVAAAVGHPGHQRLHLMPGMQASTVKPELAARYRSDGYAVSDIKVLSVSLNDVLAAQRPDAIHLLSVDVEGAESEVLQSIDLQRWRPWLIVAEATVPGTPEPNHHTWAPLLEAAGYRFAYFDGVNRFYLAAERMALAERLRLPPNVWDRFTRSACLDGAAASVADALVEAAQDQFQAQRPQQAIALLQDALLDAPDHAQAHRWRAQVAMTLADHATAVLHFARCLASGQASYDVWVNHGLALSHLHRRREALASFDAAMQAGACDAAFFLLRAQLLSELGEMAQARHSCEMALQVAPSSLAARWAQAMAHLPPVVDSVEEVHASRSAWARALTALAPWVAQAQPADAAVVGSARPFFLTYQAENNRALLSDYGRLCTRLLQTWADARGGTSPRSREGAVGAMHVGIVSAHVGEHSVWRAITRGWIEELMGHGCEVHLFHVGGLRDAQTQWAREAVSVYQQAPEGLARSAATQALDALAFWSRTLGDAVVDVLLYPEVGMDPLTIRLAALRLARVQAVSWGHPETSGLPTMDYFLSADALEPPNAQDHYTERLVRLPGLGCRPQWQVSTASVALDGLALRWDAPVFVCPGAPFKYGPADDQVLVEIARALGRCTFVFFQHAIREDLSQKMLTRLGRAFAQAGLAMEDFVQVRQWQPLPVFHALMRHPRVVVLDTLAFSGFNTLWQAVLCGAPVVTCEGAWLRARLGAGILRQIGLADRVVTDAQAYVAQAVTLAQDDLARAEVRARTLEGARAVQAADSAPQGIADFVRSVGCAPSFP